jgi:hypothetical protein
MYWPTRTSYALVSMYLKAGLGTVGVLTAALLLSVPLFSQTSTGRILGVVKDQTGGTVAGATITVTDISRGVSRSLTSDEAGTYLATNLLPSTYKVQAVFTGFQTWARENVQLEVGQDIVVDVVLQPGAQSQTVTVTEELPLLNASSSTLGGTLSNENINELPLNGRNYQNLLELRPGVVLNLGNNATGGGAASTNGMRNESSNEYLIEGLHGMDPYTGMSVMNAFQVNGDASTLLSVDAIQEFNTQFNPKASYGLKAGGSVNVGLKSGTNAIHGTGYAFFRRDALDARNFFNIAAQPKVNSDVNQFGATVGGPLKKEKLFYFLGYEQRITDLGNASSTQAGFTDPTMLTGVCSGPGASLATCLPIPNSVAGSRTPDAASHFILACLALPAASRSPQSLSMLGLNADCSPGTVYPNPNFFVPHGGNDHGATSNTAFGINSYFPNTQTNTEAMGGLAKIDYHLNDKNSLSGFLFDGRGYGPDGSTNVNPIWRTDFVTNSLMAGGTWTWLPSSNVANSLRFGYASLNLPSIGVDTETGVTAAQLGLPTGVTAPENAGLSAIAINGFYSLGSRMTEFQGPNNTREFSDQVSYLRGKHALLFGGTVIVEHQNGAIWAAGKGTFSFGSGGDGLAAFLAGQNAVPAIGGIAPLSTGLQTATLLYGNPNTHIHRNSYGLFLQDDFRVRPTLTLNLGVRYDYSSVPKDRDSILGGFDPNAGIVQEGAQIPAISNPDYNNFSPRLGFAWDVSGNGKTVVRAGGSIIYELITLRTYSEVNNSPALGGNPTSWVIGCSTPTTTLGVLNPIPAGATTNCAGALLTPGGTRNVGVVSYSISNASIGAVQWDGPAKGTSGSIFPTSAINNCSPFVLVRDNPAVTTADRAGAPCDLNTADRNLRTPYVSTWTLSIERALRSNVVLDVAYVGNHGTKLLGRTDDNQAPSGPGWNAVVPSGANAGKTLLQVCNLTGTASTCDAGKLDNKTLFTNGQTALGLFTNTVQAAKPFGLKYPYIGVIARVWNRDDSNYDALQMSLTARNYHRLSINTGYTFGKALGIGDNNNDGVSIDAYNPRMQYGPLATDVRHRLTTSLTYAFPERRGYAGLLQGWKMNNLIHYQTGLSWAPTDTRDFQGVSKAVSRWNFSGNPNDFVTDYNGVQFPIFHPAGATVPAPAATGNNPQVPGTNYAASDLAINTAACTTNAASMAALQAFGCWTEGSSALTPPAPNTYGDAVKGIFRGPHYWNLDTSVTKTQKFTERLSAEFRGEFFNILNHPVFSNPAVSLNQCTASTCTFGKTSTTPDVAAGNAVLGSGGARRIQLGVKLIF